MYNIHHVNDLLALNGRHFIDATYLAILKRNADENGMAHHLERLRSGESKERIILSLSRSEEAAAMHVKLPGLASLEKPFSKFLRWFHEMTGLARMERTVNRLEYQLFEQNEQIARQLSDMQRLLNASRATSVQQMPVPPDRVDQLFADARRTLGEAADASGIMEGLARVVRTSALAQAF